MMLQKANEMMVRAIERIDGWYDQRRVMTAKAFLKMGEKILDFNDWLFHKMINIATEMVVADLEAREREK